MAKINLNDVQGGYNLSQINSNFTQLEDALNEGLLWRDLGGGVDANQMENDLDMNGNRIYNLPNALSPHEPVTLAQLAGFAAGDAGPITVLPATNVTYVPSFPLTENTVQGALDRLTSLINVIDTSVIASDVPIAPISGMVSSNVQQALEELKISIGGGGGGGGPTFIIPVLDNVAQLRNFARGTATAVEIINHSGMGDGGGGLYAFSASASGDRNGGIVSAQGGGSWVLVDSPSVKHFGARGDGSTNDTVAMQNALDFAGTFPSRLEIPSGTYMVTGLVYNHTYLASIKIEGHGNGTTIIRHIAGSTNNLIRFENTFSPTDIGPNGLLVEGIHFRGNFPDFKPASPVGYTQSAVYTRLAFVNNFVDCRFSHADVALTLQSGVLDRFERCYFDYSNIGVRVYGANNTTCWFSNCDIKNNYLWGLNNDDGRHVVLHLCSVESNGPAVGVGGGVFSGNQVGSEGGSDFLSRGMTIRDCWFEFNKGSASIIFARGLNSIQGCIFANTTTAQTIRIGGGRYNIRDTLFENNTSGAHIFEEKTGLVFAGNIILDCVVGPTRGDPVADVDPLKTRTSYGGSGGGGTGTGDVVGPPSSLDTGIAEFNGTTGKLIKGTSFSVAQLRNETALKQDQLVSGTNIKTVNGTSILGAGNLTVSGGSSKPRMVVIGDSLSAQQGSLGSAWPTLLNDSLRSNGVDMEVHNLSVNGLAFSTAGSEIHFNGTSTVVAKAISLSPEIVIVALGANDAITGARTVATQAATVSAFVSNATSVFNALRTALPSAVILYASTITWDKTHKPDPNSSTVLSRESAPLFFQRSLSGITAGYLSPAMLPLSISPDNNSRYAGFQQADTSVRALGTINGTIDYDLWRIGRLGGVGADGIHPNAIGHRLANSAIYEGLRLNSAAMTKMVSLGWQLTAQWNSFNTIFNDFMQDSGTAWVERTSIADVDLHTSKHVSEFGSIRPKSWFYLSGGQVTTNASNLVPNAIYTFTAMGTKPNTVIEVSNDGATFITSETYTDSFGCASLSYNHVSLAGASPLSYNFYAKVGEEVFGPFSLNVAASAGSGAAAEAAKLTTARLINGTSFNGTADITTSKWGAARSITIGSATKVTDGSAGVSFSLAEIGVPSTTVSHAKVYNGSGGSWYASATPVALSVYDAAAVTGITHTGGYLTVTATGYYVINAGLFGSTTAGVGLLAAILVNGSSVAVGSSGYLPSGSGVVASTVGISIGLIAGQYIQLAYQATGAGTFSPGAATMYLSATKVA